jgi:FkbM family methyltransferase
MYSLRRWYRYFGIPAYSLVSNKIPFTFFYKSEGEWMMRMRGVSLPIKEPRLTALEYFRHFIPEKGGIVFDIGGERGLEARQFSKLVGSDGKVYTFECFPKHVQLLKSLAEENRNIEVVEKACWNEKTDLTFFIGNTPGSNTAIPDAKGQFNQALANNENNKLVVNADTLDNLWRELTGSSPIEFLKMDIEGAEYEALEGATEMLMSTRLVVIASYHIRAGIPTAPRVYDMLHRAGFDVRIDDNNHVYGVRHG